MLGVVGREERVERFFRCFLGLLIGVGRFRYYYGVRVIKFKVIVRYLAGEFRKAFGLRRDGIERGGFLGELRLRFIFFFGSRVSWL